MTIASLLSLLLLGAQLPEDMIYGGGPWIDTRPKPRGDALLKADMLRVHNEARAAVGQAPLAWDPGLAEEARRYAATLARENRFEHSDPRTHARREGENLWRGTRTAYSFDQMAGHWVGERKDYRPGRFPEVSHTGNWHHVGHYTQIVWRDTTAVGCGFASNRHDDYLVCRYTPAGNIFGEDALAKRPIRAAR